MKIIKHFYNIYLFVILIQSSFYGVLDCISFSNSSIPINVTRENIMSVIFEGYNNHERPSESKQTRVIVYMKVLAINSVDVLKMEYSTDVLLRQNWIDERLAWNETRDLNSYNSSITSPSLKEKVWLPDLFFRNGKKGFVHTMTLPNYLMRLSPNGNILYSQKITMRFSCQMNLSTFPMDTQECIMDIGSYGYTLDQLKFLWRVDTPIVIADNLQIPEFNPSTTPKTTDCSEKASTQTGNYTCLKVSFHLERQLGSYLASTYIPNVLIVMVSWLNFWVSIEAIPARITLGLLTLLGILTQATGMSNSLPRVSYIKAIDIWIIACIIFVIGALIEFAMASMIARKRKSEDWQKQVRDIVRQELARWCAVCQQQQRQYNQNIGAGSAAADNTGMLDAATAYHSNPGAIVPSTQGTIVNSNSNLGGGLSNTMVTEDLEILLCPESGGPPGYVSNNNSNKWKRKGGGGGGGGGAPYSKFSRSKPSTPGVVPTATVTPGGLVPTSPGAPAPATATPAAPPAPKSVDSEIDCYSRFLFPACFVLYNCFYWLYYLVLVGHR